MRPLIFLFPDDRMDVGGNSAQVRFLEACRGFTSAEAAYYGEHMGAGDRFSQWLAGISARMGDQSPIFVIHWGPDIATLLDRLKGQDVVYVAHSTGWGMALPPDVPILCVSRHTMAFWGRYAANSYIAYVPNVVNIAGGETPIVRDIDVLVQVRKSSEYLLDYLVPALRQRCRVEVLDGWVDDLNAWFRRSKVYLYDSLEHWIDVGATEGFGLPPLEAMGQGCMVFSSVNDALADYLDPGFNCRKLRVHSLEWDVANILQTVRDDAPAPPGSTWFEPYEASRVSARLEFLFTDIARFFEMTARVDTNIDDVWVRRQLTPLQRAKQAVRVLAGM